MWGSSPLIDTARGQVVVGVGNMYQLPKSVEAACIKSGSSFSAQEGCLRNQPGGKDAWANAVLAIGLEDGKLR